MHSGQQAGWAPDAISHKLRPSSASNKRVSAPRRSAQPLRATRLEQQSSAAEQQVQQPEQRQLAQQCAATHNAAPLGTGRPVAAAAAVAALAGSGAACYAALSAQPQLPPLEDVLVAAATVLLGGPLLVLAAAKAALRDRLHVELHRQVGGGHGPPNFEPRAADLLSSRCVHLWPWLTCCLPSPPACTGRWTGSQAGRQANHAPHAPQRPTARCLPPP